MPHLKVDGSVHDDRYEDLDGEGRGSEEVGWGRPVCEGGEVLEYVRQRQMEGRGNWLQTHSKWS